MDRSAMTTWVRLTHVYTRLSRIEAEHFRSLGIGIAHFDALVQTMQNEGLTQQELAANLLVTKGNVCYLVDKLEAEKLLERRHEGKTKRLFLTAKGRTLIESILPAHQDLVSSFFSSLSLTEQRDLRTLLRKLDKAITV